MFLAFRRLNVKKGGQILGQTAYHATCKTHCKQVQYSLKKLKSRNVIILPLCSSFKKRERKKYIVFLVYLQAATSMVWQSDFSSYSCYSSLILKITSPTASIGYSNDSTHRRKVSSLLRGCFCSNVSSPGPLRQGHAIASERDGEVLAKKQQY